MGAPISGWRQQQDSESISSGTVVVPHPGELWLSVTAGLLDVATVVIAKPPVPVSAQQAERLKSRLRMKDAALVCWGGGQGPTRL